LKATVGRPGSGAGVLGGCQTQVFALLNRQIASKLASLEDWGKLKTGFMGSPFMRAGIRIVQTLTL
jgi:hypothetical protein